MSGFGEGSRNIAPRYKDLKKYYRRRMNKGDMNEDLADYPPYKDLLEFIWEGKLYMFLGIFVYIAAIKAGIYKMSDKILYWWVFINHERRNFFAYYRAYADAYNAFIAKKMKDGMPVHLVVYLDEALDIAHTGKFTYSGDFISEEINTKSFSFVPDLDLDLAEPDTVILAMPATAMPFQPIWATPYLRTDRTIKSGQTIGYRDLKRQEVRLDLDDPKAEQIPDNVRPTLTVKKHINLTDHNRRVLEQRFDVKVI